MLLTHLNFSGNCAQAFKYYEEHLGGKILMMMRQSSNPQNPPADLGADAVLHARVEVGGTTLIGNDVPAKVFQPMRSAYLYFEVGSSQEAERVYEVLKRDGEAFMPLQETFFASRFSQLRDQFGVLWTLFCPREQGQAG
jgi:PhnB protein